MNSIKIKCAAAEITQSNYSIEVELTNVNDINVNIDWFLQNRIYNISDVVEGLHSTLDLKKQFYQELDISDYIENCDTKKINSILDSIDSNDIERYLRTKKLTELDFKKQ